VALADIFEQQQDYARAVEYYGRGLAIQEAELGRDSKAASSTALKVVRTALLHSSHYSPYPNMSAVM